MRFPGLHAREKQYLQGGGGEGCVSTVRKNEASSWGSCIGISILHSPALFNSPVQQMALFITN